MKKFISIFMALMLLVSVAGCSSAAEDTTDGSTPEETTEATDGGEDTTSAGGKITMFQSKVEITDQLEKVAKEYTEATGVEVEVWGSAGDDYRNQLQAHMASGEGPVMFTVGGMSELEQFSQYILDISDQEYVKNISPGLSLVKDDKTFGVPNSLEGFGMVINEAMINKDEVKDMASLEAMFEAVSADGVSPLLLSSEDYFLIAHILNTPFALQENYEEFVEKLNAGEVKMADTAEFKDFAKVMELIRDNSTNPLEVTYDKEIAALADKQAAAIHQGNWASGMLKDYDIDFDFTMIPLPINGNQKISIGVGGYWCVNSEASEEDQKLAHDFYNYLFNSDESKRILVDEFGFIPPFTNIEYKSEDPLSQVVFDYSSQGNSIPWTFPIWPQGIIESDLAPATQGFFSDTSMTGQQFLESLDEAWANGVK